RTTRAPPSRLPTRTRWIAPPTAVSAGTPFGRAVARSRYTRGPLPASPASTPTSNVDGPDRWSTTRPPFSAGYDSIFVSCTGPAAARSPCGATTCPDPDGAAEAGAAGNDVDAGTMTD